jgi:hypothetical protein
VFRDQKMWEIQIRRDESMTNIWRHKCKIAIIICIISNIIQNVELNSNDTICRASSMLVMTTEK